MEQEKMFSSDLWFQVTNLICLEFFFSLRVNLFSHVTTSDAQSRFKPLQRLSNGALYRHTSKDSVPCTMALQGE